MKLSKKILTIFIVGFIIALSAVYILCRTLLLKQFIGIEVTNAELDTKRALELINGEINNINSTAIDYAVWDDTYTFMENSDYNYIHKVFSQNNIFERSNINFVLYVDNAYNIKYANNTDKSVYTTNFLSKETMLQISKELQTIIKPGVKKGYKGILQLSNIPIIISIQPILPSNAEGNPRGLLVLAKYLDIKEANFLSLSLSVKLELKKYDKNLLLNSEYKLDNTYINIINANSLVSYGIIKDLYNNAVMMTKITSKRIIFEKASNSISFFIIILTLIGILFSLSSFFFLNKFVINRIEDITIKVDEISKTQDLSIRINMAGSDEIAQLGKHFDMLFTSLQKTKEQILKNIHEKLEDEKKILTLANYDTLTNLPNRKMLNEAVESLTKNTNTRFALLFIDLDNFKNVNDSMGHQAGDKILQQVVLRLQKIPQIRDYIFRMGGDEFIVIYKDLKELIAAETVAKKINFLFKPPFFYQNNKFYIGASIGITFYPKDGSDLQALMKNSDTAMYEAKRSGINTYKIFSSDMNEKTFSVLQMGNALRVAVENNEFILHYQPIFNVSTLEIVGCEGLIRWNHDNKIIYPGEFIKLAKDIGVMVTIDNWVLVNSCKQCKAWHEKGLKNIYVSVNVSFNQLIQPNFTKMVSKILTNIKLPPSSISLEITEDEAMADIDLIIGILNQLKAIGVKISLDDFGSGYSSLSYISKLPIDTLKIDKSLIQNLTTHSKNIEIFKSIIYMASNLNIGVIVEGVEREDQLEILKSLNCQLVQGYLFSKPLEVAAFEEFIKRGIH